MAKEGGFFSPNRKVSGKDKQVASSMSAGSYGGYIDAGERRGFVSPEQADKMIKNPEAYKMRPSETRYLRESMGLPRAQFFSPSGNEIGQIASATSDLGGLLASKQPLSPIGSDAYNKEVEGFIKSFKDDFMYRNKFDVDTGIRKDKFGRPIPGERFGEEEMKRDYPFRRQFRYENFDGEKYQPGVPFGKKEEDTKIAMDNLGGYGAIGGVLTLGGLGIKGIQSAIEGGKKLKENIEKRVNPESIQDKIGGFFNRLTLTSPVAAGTLDAQPKQVGYQPVGPKLNYVNPDAKTMTLSQIGEAFKPKNLFGYQDKFGRYDDPGSPLDKQRQETMQRVYNRFTRPITPDARTIAQIRQDQKDAMQEAARLRYQDFKDKKALGPAANIQKTFGADDTYGTGVPSNPAMGFSGKMDAEAQAAYAKAAKEATAGAQTDPSLGNVMVQTYNRVAARFGLPQKNLQTIDQRQLQKAQEAYNKPRYQQEAYARKMLGITNDMIKADNMQRIRANAFARNQAFQLQKAIKASERAAKRLGGNIGTGRDGGFGTGTEGKGLPSNPQGFSGYSRKSSPSTGTGTGTSTSKSRPGSKKASRGSSPGSRSRGGTGTGGGKAKASGSRGQGGGTASRSKGGSFGGSRRSTNTKKSRRRCDIRTKIDITSLTNPNLVKDDLATIAYFVQELKG